MFSIWTSLVSHIWPSVRPTVCAQNGHHFHQHTPSVKHAIPWWLCQWCTVRNDATLQWEVQISVNDSVHRCLMNARFPARFDEHFDVFQVHLPGLKRASLWHHCGYFVLVFGLPLLAFWSADPVTSDCHTSQISAERDRGLPGNSFKSSLALYFFLVSRSLSKFCPLLLKLF